MPMKKISGAYLKKLRLENGYSLRSLGERLYVSKSTVDNWEKKDCLSDSDLIQALAKLYGIDEEDLTSHSPQAANESMQGEDSGICLEANAKANFTPKSNRKKLKIGLIVFYVLLVLVLLGGICITGIHAFSNTEGFGKILINNYSIKQTDLFIMLLVFFICLIAIFIFLIIRLNGVKIGNTKPRVVLKI